MELLQELIGFGRKKTPIPPTTKPSQDDKIMARLYREMRKAYQKIVANRIQKVPLDAMRAIYQQFSNPLLRKDKNDFIKVINTWPKDPKHADAYSTLMGRFLSQLSIEDIEFESSQDMFNAIYNAAKALDPDDETN